MSKKVIIGFAVMVAILVIANLVTGRIETGRWTNIQTA